MQIINKLIVEKIPTNKSIIFLYSDLTIQKSLITIIPFVINKGIEHASISVCLSYLREIKGDDQIIAQNAINNVLENYHKNKEDYIDIYKSILTEIGSSLKDNILNHQKNQ